MTKTKVTPLIRMVFLFWLTVSIALVGTTISRSYRCPTGATGTRSVQLLTSTSTVSTTQVRCSGQP
jgi:hypothetical protein